MHGPPGVANAVSTTYPTEYEGGARPAEGRESRFSPKQKRLGDLDPVFKRPAYLSGGGLSSAAMGNSAGGPWACWIRRCARAPGLTSVHDPRVGSGAGDEMFDGVIPLGEALRPLDLSRPSTRVACRQRVFGSWPRRIGVSEGLTRAKGLKLVFGSSGLAGTGCRIARPKPGSSGQGIGALAGCRGLGRGSAAA